MRDFLRGAYLFKRARLCAEEPGAGTAPLKRTVRHLRRTALNVFGFATHLLPLREHLWTELAPLDEIMEIALNGFARDLELARKRGDVWPLAVMAHAVEDFMLPVQPKSEAAFGFVRGDFFGVLERLQHRHCFPQAAPREGFFNGTQQFVKPYGFFQNVMSGQWPLQCLKLSADFERARNDNDRHMRGRGFELRNKIGSAFAFRQDVIKN